MQIIFASIYLYYAVFFSVRVLKYEVKKAKI